MTGWRMRPTASALGVIAIVSVMITATPSEADNGAIESSSINHRRVDEEDERTANQTVANDLAAGVTLRARVNDTANETPPAAPTRSTYYYFPLANASQANESGAAELQRDQSDLLSVVAVASSNDVREQDANDPLRSTERSGDPGSKAQPANDDFVASTRPNRAEIASSIVPLESRLPGSRNEDQDLSNVVDREDELEPDSRKREDSIGLTTASTREIVATSVVKPIEQKNAEENVRAISFQVPAVAEEVAEDAVRQRQDNEQARNAMEPRKDHSRPVNNLVLPGGKSTKAFYEIKPSIKTEMEPDQLNPSSTQRPLPGRKFVLPSVDSAFGKFGPYFEDGDQEINVTARIGSTMLLDCKIGMLGNKEVTWVQQPSKDSFRLLTFGRIPYSVDQRISLNFRYPSNWRLQIQYATPRDSGLYKCQVATHPPLVKTINVVVTAPELTITDDSGRVVSKERHLKAGSALKLRCEARDVIESLKESVIWTRGDETLTEDVSENRTTEILAGKEVLVIVSTLIVERASPRHAGNYSCVVPGKAKTTVAVHVLNGELPAAVHDGNGVSRAFLNLWLIHLTMSYVFSR